MIADIVNHEKERNKKAPVVIDADNRIHNETPLSPVRSTGDTQRERNTIRNGTLKMKSEKSQPCQRYDFISYHANENTPLQYIAKGF